MDGSVEVFLLAVTSAMLTANKLAVKKDFQSLIENTVNC